MKIRAPRNRTIVLQECDIEQFLPNLITVTEETNLQEIVNRTIHQTMENALVNFPENCVDLLILDPPYNLYKRFTLLKKSPV